MGFKLISTRYPLEPFLHLSQNHFNSDKHTFEQRKFFHHLNCFCISTFRTLNVNINSIKCEPKPRKNVPQIKNIPREYSVRYQRIFCMLPVPFSVSAIFVHVSKNLYYRKREENSFIRKYGNTINYRIFIYFY